MVRQGYFHQAVLIMPRYSCLLLILMTSCAPPLSTAIAALEKCPHIGIDVGAPNFSQRHTKADIEAFYPCVEIAIAPTETQTPFDTSGPLGQALLGHPEARKEMLSSLQYQHILWREVISHEKTPDSAQEAWMIWDGNKKAQRALINAQRSNSIPSAPSMPRPMTCMANGPFLNCN